MTDDSLTPAAELASAALDNEVTSAERANIAGSLVLSAEMGVYGEIRAWLADVDVPPAARENALAAALAAFDEIQPEGDARSGVFRAAPAGVASLRDRRRRSDQWLKGLAAAAVVAAVGVGAIAVLGRGRGTGSGSKSSAATQPQTAEQNLPRVASAGATVDANADTALTAAATAGSVPELAASVSPWSTAPMLNSAEAVLVFVSTPGFGAMQSSTAPDASGPASSTAASIAASTAGTTAGTTAPAPGADGGAKGAGGSATPCIDGAQLSAFAYYKGQRAVVVSDTGRKLISVVDADTCGLITTIAIP